MNSGIYCLIIRLKKSSIITTGKLGTFKFPAGYYIYTGSAKKNLSQRVERHKRKNNKRLKWHIDYLLNNRYAVIEKVELFVNSKYTECSLNKKIMTINGSEIIVKNFGASDCRNKCGSHLLYFNSLSFNIQNLEI